MVRMVPVALLIMSLPVAAWSKPPAADAGQRQTFNLPRSSDHYRFAPGPAGRTEIAPNAHFGFGIFGMKSEKSFLQRVTGREIDAPKQRRAAVGFSLKF